MAFYVLDCGEDVEHIYDGFVQITTTFMMHNNVFFRTVPFDWVDNHFELNEHHFWWHSKADHLNFGCLRYILDFRSMQTDQPAYVEDQVYGIDIW